MDAHGYIFKGKASKLDPSYIPSLIGVNLNRPITIADAAYFEQIEITDRRITSIERSPYVVYDEVTEETPAPEGNATIVVVRSPGGDYYIPSNELAEIAAANQDDETFELLGALFPAYRV
ncbi:hypothetical protein [Sphingobium sp. MK2]|uniref:hypothetical protein n=1 Tax=Sphingobium sp. MK2 TaxID=3116540 RepID=UPI0032E365C6